LFVTASTSLAGNGGHPVAYLASAYALVGREQEAREALSHYLKLCHVENLRADDWNR
jgi:hypothetical protein